MTDQEALRDVASGFITGMCSCNSPSGKLTGHTCGCPVATHRASLKRMFKMAANLDGRNPLTRQQWIRARCWDNATL